MSDLANPSSRPPVGVRPRALLSPRDLELLRHVAAGNSTGQMAEAMSVSRNTVRTRLRRVRGKLGAGSREQIAQRTRELGVL